MKRSASELTSSTSTPTIVPFECVRRFCQRASTGASPLHGGHHDAQKFSTTTLPRYEESFTSPPPSSFGSDTSGAAGRFPAASCESIDWLVPFLGGPSARRGRSAR